MKEGTTGTVEVKACQACKVARPYPEFNYSADSEDRLSGKCRWCMAYKHGSPTPQQIEVYIKDYRTVLERAADLLKEKVRLPNAGRSTDILQDNRTLYENILTLIHDRLELTKDWDYPCWISKSTLFTGEQNNAS